MDNTIALSGSERFYLVHEVPVGCDEKLVPNCNDRKQRATKWSELEKQAAQKRKKRAEKALEEEEKKRKEAKEFAERCDKQEWALTKERNDKMWKYLQEQTMINGGADETTKAPDKAEVKASGRRLLTEGEGASTDFKTRDCGIPKPGGGEGGDGGTTEAKPDGAQTSSQTAVGRRKHHNVQEDIFKRVQSAVAADLLKKGAKPGQHFDQFGRDLKKLRILPSHTERMTGLSAEERGERYEHLGRDEAEEEKHPYVHFREEAVNMNNPHRGYRGHREVPVRSNNELRGEQYEYKVQGRSRSADGRSAPHSEGNYRYRQYMHHYQPRRVRSDGTPMLTEVGGGNSLDDYDDDDGKETSVEKKQPKKEVHLDKGPGDGSDILDDTQDKIDEHDGHDDYDQPVHNDEFDEDPEE